MGLDDPLWQQYFDSVKSLLRFGILVHTLTSRGLSVWDTIREYFPATVELAFFSMLVAVVVGVGVGTLSAAMPGTIWDAGGRLFGIITYSLPLFWVGMVLQLIFSVNLGWFPLGTRFPVNAATPPQITGLYTVDSLITGNIGMFGEALY